VDIEDTLATELTEQASSLLEGYGEGWSDDEEVEILNLEVGEEELEARFAIHFEEVIPSGCRDMPHHREGRVELVLQMRREEDRAVIGDSDSNPSQWDLWDRNSAADGT